MFLRCNGLGSGGTQRNERRKLNLRQTLYPTNVRLRFFFLRGRRIFVSILASFDHRAMFHRRVLPDKLLFRAGCGLSGCRSGAPTAWRRCPKPWAGAAPESPTFVADAPAAWPAVGNPKQWASPYLWQQKPATLAEVIGTACGADAAGGVPRGARRPRPRLARLAHRIPDQPRPSVGSAAGAAATAAAGVIPGGKAAAAPESTRSKSSSSRHGARHGASARPRGKSSRKGRTHHVPQPQVRAAGCFPAAARCTSSEHAVTGKLFCRRPFTL